MKVRIVSDTTSGLPQELGARLGIPILPQIVIFGGDSYRDDIEMDTATFLVRLKASRALPKTAAPPPAFYNPIYQKILSDGEAAIVLGPSAKLSGTVRSAELAAQDFPGADIRVIDTLTNAGNLATLVLLADEVAKAGEEADQVVAKIQEWMPRQRTYFLVDTLEYLQKGGRIGGAKALLGEMLQIKPILVLQDGQAEVYEQQRTQRRARQRLIEIVEEQCPHGPEAHLCVMHADALEAARSLVADLQSGLRLEQVPIYELPPAIVVHAGPGTLAVGFFSR